MLVMSTVPAGVGRAAWSLDSPLGGTWGLVLPVQGDSYCVYKKPLEEALCLGQQKALGRGGVSMRGFAQ